jgi:alanine racemase
MTTPETAGGILTIDLDALAANWRLLASKLKPGCACGAVVKANAYGIGADRAAPVLARAGCEHFFVATVDEGLALRAVLAEAGSQAAIHVFNGPAPGAHADMAHARLSPVLNSLEQIADWAAFCRAHANAPAADVHVDTGMSRLGLSPDERRRLGREPALLKGVRLGYLLSHLTSAEEDGTPESPRQLTAFTATRAELPDMPASLANSSGLFLGPDYHFDLARPGASLYGVNPTPGKPNPMAQVVRLQGKILQVRQIDTPQTVGYGATHAVSGPARIATLGVGYADGYLRCLGNKGTGYIGETPVPVVGRISMDLTTVDVTAIPEAQCRPGMTVDLIGPNVPVDAVADAADTIGYEILTALGPRYHRIYVGNGDSGAEGTR